MRPITRTPIAVAAVIAGALMTSPQAVADKVVKAIGVDGVEFKINSLISKLLAPADNAGSSTITSLITAVIALLFLAAIVYLVLGLIQSIRGTRGGVETVAQVVIGLVFAVAAFQILA